MTLGASSSSLASCYRRKLLIGLKMLKLVICTSAKVSCKTWVALSRSSLPIWAIVSLTRPESCVPKRSHTGTQKTSSFKWSSSTVSLLNLTKPLKLKPKKALTRWSLILKQPLKEGHFPSLCTWKASARSLTTSWTTFHSSLKTPFSRWPRPLKNTKGSWLKWLTNL